MRSNQTQIVKVRSMKAVKIKINNVRILTNNKLTWKMRGRGYQPKKSITLT